jgi:SpoVK/Ycf46/Vps4 family AAA+-type ATPase
LDERHEVLRVACRSVGLGPDVDLARVAGACEGMTYADVNALVYSAQLNAASAGGGAQEQRLAAGDRPHQQLLAAEDFEAALKSTPLSLPRQVSANVVCACACFHFAFVV